MRTARAQSLDSRRNTSDSWRCYHYLFDSATSNVTNTPSTMLFFCRLPILSLKLSRPDKTTRPLPHTTTSDHIQTQSTTCACASGARNREIALLSTSKLRSLLRWTQVCDRLALWSIVLVRKLLWRSFLKYCCFLLNLNLLRPVLRRLCGSAIHCNSIDVLWHPLYCLACSSYSTMSSLFLLFNNV